MFGSPIAGFNVRGRKEIKTNAGAFVSMLITIIVLLFASIKLIELNEKKNPSITSYERPNPTDYETPINLNEIGFRVAFAWYDVWPENKPRDDPAYVKNYVTYVQQIDDVRTKTLLPFHKCTEEDYAEFFPIAQN